MTSRIVIEPPYECEYCNTPIAGQDIKHTHEVRNEAPKYFCSVGCFYGWASEGEMTTYDDHIDY